MKLYNTAIKSVEEITSVHGNDMSVYTCGPTVYDYPHIGNWYTFIRYDLLVRTLRAVSFDVQWVMNITDVGHLVSDADDGEDKLQKGARREGKNAYEVADYYSQYFIEGLSRLNIGQPTHTPKATEHIAEQIELVSELEKHGHTYVISDGVYFDTSTFPTYGSFARLDIDEQQAGARVEYNPEKRNNSDFALWKFSTEGQNRDMEWDSPWSRPGDSAGNTKGFPGWHIECSAMSMKYLGKTIDIHCGGIDHIPVHHTNEIAQSEAATGKPYSRYWMHTNHIMIEGDKISKSLGNAITLEDIISHGYSLDDFRLHVLESHYRSQSRFSWDSLAAARNRLYDLRALAALRWQTIPTLHDHSTFEFSDVASELVRIMADDLHTEACLTYLSEVTKQTTVILVASEEHDAFVAMLEAIDGLLGTRLSQEKDITNDQKQLITERERARAKRDWHKSDKLRDLLLSENIGVRDTSYGTIWYPALRS